MQVCVTKNAWSVKMSYDFNVVSADKQEKHFFGGQKPDYKLE